ncbi:hypothetical protein L2E82_47856 [Cichorium intybus]|uniref:Uncharacterized protein n=1 Tax=Cichorium intybus TaxID=13427 RepID=A0ACB8YWR9_CICIN|nr:hypothetical protein L2E82_47856 [Cichorium intybus]
MAENESRPEGLPSTQGGKYVGFGSSPNPIPRPNAQGDVLSSVRNGGYDYKVNETVNVVVGGRARLQGGRR